MEKSVLLVSPYPYSPSTRGMDVLTNAFAESGWKTHHLMFPKVLYSVRMPVSPAVHQLRGRLLLLPYIDRFMHGIPTYLFHRFVKTHRRSVSHVDWTCYDVVVLESGKPLFLLDSIPEGTRLVYRQSDSVRLILGKNPDYIALEDRIIRQAEDIIVPNERFRRALSEDCRSKTSVVPNGVTVPEGGNVESPYAAGSVNAVNIGLYPLDRDVLFRSCRENPGIDFHVFGTGLGRWNRRQDIPNLKCYGFASAAVFLPYLIHADMFVFPFKYTEREEYYGLTSKYCMAMRFGLPIVSSPRGPKEDFEGLPVDFCANAEEFSRTVGEIGNTRPRRVYNLDWAGLDPVNILALYKKWIAGLETSIQKA